MPETNDVYVVGDLIGLDEPFDFEPISILRTLESAMETRLGSERAVGTGCAHGLALAHHAGNSPLTVRADSDTRFSLSRPTLTR